MAENKWQTTFEYLQDLRSLYMNSVLSSVVKPGIYNANLYAYATDNGISLYVGKGTTLMFSNNYKIDGSHYVKDYDSNLSSDNYIIKAVATSSFSTTILSLSSVGMKDVIGGTTGENCLEQFFIVACINYDSNSKDSSNTTPTFCVYKMERNGTKNFVKYTFVASSDNTTWANLDDENSPNGGKTSYLILGRIVDISSKKGTKINSYYGDNKVNANDWNANHVFTARGISEYRQGFVSDTNKFNPSFYIGNDLNSLYLDTKEISIGKNLYNTSYNLNDVVLNPSAEATYKLSLSNSSSTLIGNISSLHDFDTKSNISCVLLNYFIYAITSSEESDTLYSGSLDTLFERDNSLKLFYVRWYSDASKLSLDSLDPKKNLKEYYSEETISNSIPLDVSRNNTKRLVSLIYNRNIIAPVIDLMRRESIIEDGNLNAIVPIALIFKPYQRVSSTVSGNTVYDYTLVDSSSENSFDSANVLDFFSLQYGDSRINNIEIKSDLTFNKLSII